MSGSKRARLRNWWQQITKGSPSEKEDQQSNLSDNNEPDPVNGAPSSGKYILSATKQTLAILRGVAGLVPFPGVKEAVDLGLIVIETCEGISEVRGQVSDLEDRIISVLLVVAKVAKEQQLSSESQPSAAHSTFLQDVTELSSCFKDILKKLKDIREQKTWIVAVMQRDNKEAIQGCIDDFQFALARFQMLRSLYMDQNFSEIQFQLESIYDLNKAMADDLTVVRQDVQFIRTKLDQTTSEKPSSSFLIMDVPPIPRIFFGRCRSAE